MDYTIFLRLAIGSTMTGNSFIHTESLLIPAMVCSHSTSTMPEGFCSENCLLMHAMGANTARQLSSVVASGVVQTLLSGLL